MWTKLVGWFQTLPEDTIRRGVGQKWTTTHGFFIQMGGFVLYKNEYPDEVIDYDLLVYHLRKKTIDAPTVTKRELDDRSKGDTISKAIVVLQTTWFVLQCIARAERRLPLSELEVLTLAFAVVNATIYAAWWNKPQGVDMPICVPWKSANGDVQNTSTSSMGKGQHGLVNLSHLGPVNPPHLIASDKQHPNKQSRKKHRGWLRRMVHKDREEYMSPVFLLIRLPYRVVCSLLRPLAKLYMGHDEVITKDNQEDLRVPMFYAPMITSGALFKGSTRALCIIGTIFGAIHLLAWASKFPSLPYLVLWRVSAILLTITPGLLVLNGWISNTGKTSRYITRIFGLLIVPLYITSRLVVIIVALLTIRHPPHDVTLDVSWTSYLPHF